MSGLIDFIVQNLGKIIVGIILFVGLVYVIKNYAKIKKFFYEVKIEMEKFSWPTKKELLGSTWIVIVVTIIMVIFLGTVDLSLSKMLSLILKS